MYYFSKIPQRKFEGVFDFPKITVLAKNNFLSVEKGPEPHAVFLTLSLFSQTVGIFTITQAEKVF